MKALMIKCPTCKQRHNYYQSKPWSPFCCERCRLIDLGAWVSEEHKIKGESVSCPTDGSFLANGSSPQK